MPSSAPPPLVSIEPGTKLDRYELLCVLAHGGMANVWLARVQGKMGFERLFAVKTILPSVADDAAFKAMFLDEARIASRIQHPNVVHMTDVGEAGLIPYLVMDLVDGEPLHKLPRACEKAGQRIPLGVILRILADACHGLHAAHEMQDTDGHLLGVVHRDMSPQNILVSAAGVSKVIDFGVAKARDRFSGQTSVGTLKGKISFMPREQALGQEVDRRADTWALGAVLYYLLSGRPPFKGENQLATLQLAMNGAPIPPLAQSLPLSLRMAVTRSLAHEPGQRFQTAAEMGEALEGLMRKLGVVTTHAEVGAFVQHVLGDKLAARRQLIQNALAEAANRETARKALTAVPVDVESDEKLSDSHSSGLVAVPTAVISNPGTTNPGLEDSSPRNVGYDPANIPSTGATFVAHSPPPNNRKLLPAIIGGGAILAVVGTVLIIVSLKATQRPAAEQKAAAASTETATAPIVNPSTPSTGVPTEPASPSGAAIASASASAAASAKVAAAGNRPVAPAFVPPQPQPAAPAKHPGTPGGGAAPATPKKEDYGF